MSWTVDVQGSSEYPYTKYKISADCEGEAAERVKSSQFELDRKTIVDDFQRLLPHISGEIPRFRSLSKFADEDPLQSCLSNFFNRSKNILCFTGGLEKCDRGCEECSHKNR
jgi:hypothetical protein